MNIQRRLTLRDKIEQDLIASAAARMPVDKSNAGSTLWPIFYWQVVEEIASKCRKQGWEVAWSEGVVPNDDQLRARGAGEFLIIDSNHFSALASVTKPICRFDRDLFLEKVAKKYKLDKEKLAALAESCKTGGKAALSKSVVEAAK